MSAISFPASRSHTYAGIFLTSVAYLLFTVHDAIAKLLVASIPVWQVLFFRSATILVACLIFGGCDLYAEAARSRTMKPMFLRSFLILGAWLCYYTAARDLQLAELTTIYFAAPVIVTLLSVFILGERVPLMRWAAVLIGFVGVYLACDPATLGLSPPVVLVLVAAFLWGLAIVLLRKIALREKTIIQLILNNGFFLVTAGLPLLFFWQTPSPNQILLLLGAGVVSGVAQFMLFEGMKRAEASVVAPFEYTSLIWAFLLGYLIWADMPRREVFEGAALIMGAGLLIIAGEHFRTRDLATKK